MAKESSRAGEEFAAQASSASTEEYGDTVDAVLGSVFD